ncbi:hypothetical protein LZ30DRAFT_786404 [Colletotrichum cereale]|nr:hypothetical protein LZ30DRAFT_786404 [Colletotrichum cereale]
MFYANASGVSWLTMDRATYDYKALGHFELAYGDDGRVESVLPKASTMSLTRIEDGESAVPTNMQLDFSLDELDGQVIK